MQNNTQNPNPAMVEAVRAHVALRVDLLASCARAANGLNNAASRFAYSELRAIRTGLTDLEAVQAAVCAKFPKLTGNGKPSKTPNSSFRTSWDKIALLASVLDGSNKTYERAEAKAIAESFIADDNARPDGSLKLTLNDVCDRIRDDKAAAGRAKAAAKTDAEKEAEKAAEEAATVAAYVNAVAESPLMLSALADRIAAFTTDDMGKAEAVAKLREATGTFAETIIAMEAEAEKKAA